MNKSKPDHSWKANPWVWALSFKRVDLSDREAKPIIFSGPMVRAILADQKTQTRRIKTPQPPESLHKILQAYPRQQGCPYGRPGDLLWVREAHMLEGAECRANLMANGTIPPEVIYRATAADFVLARVKGFKWRPSIFMFRWACRIMLELTDVRVERVQDLGRISPTPRRVEAGPHPIIRKFLLWLYNHVGMDSKALILRKLYPDGPQTHWKEER